MHLIVPQVRCYLTLYSCVPNLIVAFEPEVASVVPYVSTQMTAMLTHVYYRGTNPVSY